MFMSLLFIISINAFGQDFLSFERHMSDGHDVIMHGGVAYEGTEYVPLEDYLENSCSAQSQPALDGRRIAFVGSIWLVESLRTCSGSSCLHGVYNPNNGNLFTNEGRGNGRFDPVAVDFGRIYEQMEQDSRYICEEWYSSACVVGIHGTIRKTSLDMTDFDGGIVHTLERGECVIVAEEVVFGGTQNRWAWVAGHALRGGTAAFEAFSPFF